MTRLQNKGKKLTGLRSAQRSKVSFPNAARATGKDAVDGGPILLSLSVSFHSQHVVTQSKNVWKVSYGSVIVFCVGCRPGLCICFALYVVCGMSAVCVCVCCVHFVCACVLCI